jgi:hypothetical protein
MIENRVGPPVRGDDFYGREAFVELVSEKLKAGHVLLAAPRRFGKTSVMYRLIDAPRWNYRVIHADLQYLTEPAELITHLVEKLAADDRLSKVVKGLSYVPRKLWSFFSGSFEELELLQIRLKLRDRIRPQWQQSGEELFKRVAAAEETIIFFLDELPMMLDAMASEEASRREAKTLLRWLRALRVSPEIKNVRFLIAGSIGIGHVLAELGEEASINDFEQLRLDPFPPKVAAGLIDLLAESKNLSLSKPTRKRMLDLIGTPVPYFIQIIFSEVAKAYAQDGEMVTPKKVDRIYRDRVLGVDCKTYFDHYYGRLREYYRLHEERAAKRLLRELAVSGSLRRDACFQFYKEAVSAADIDEFVRLMTDLENDFYIRFDHGRQSYEFSCKLLRDWWLRHYGMETGD